MLDYATAMSRTPTSVTDELFAAMREHFDERQLVELTNVIALENMRARFNSAFDMTPAGFSEGMVCVAAGRRRAGARPTRSPRLRMRVFLAGATGVIGRRLVPMLLADGHQVTGMTRSPEQAQALRALRRRAGDRRRARRGGGARGGARGRARRA